MMVCGDLNLPFVFVNHSFYVSIDIQCPGLAIIILIIITLYLKRVAQNSYKTNKLVAL
jgi:hypothetical protein